MALDVHATVIAEFLFEVAVDAFECIVGLWDQTVGQKDEQWMRVMRQESPCSSEVPMGIPPGSGCGFGCIGFCFEE